VKLSDSKEIINNRIRNDSLDVDKVFEDHHLKQKEEASLKLKQLDNSLKISAQKDEEKIKATIGQSLKKNLTNFFKNKKKQENHDAKVDSKPLKLRNNINNNVTIVNEQSGLNKYQPKISKNNEKLKFSSSKHLAISEYSFNPNLSSGYNSFDESFESDCPEQSKNNNHSKFKPNESESFVNVKSNSKSNRKNKSNKRWIQTLELKKNLDLINENIKKSYDFLNLITTNKAPRLNKSTDTIGGGNNCNNKLHLMQSKNVNSSNSFIRQSLTMLQSESSDISSSSTSKISSDTNKTSSSDITSSSATTLSSFKESTSQSNYSNYGKESSSCTESSSDDTNEISDKNSNYSSITTSLSRTSSSSSSSSSSCSSSSNSSISKTTFESKTESEYESEIFEQTSNSNLKTNNSEEKKSTYNGSKVSVKNSANSYFTRKELKSIFKTSDFNKLSAKSFYKSDKVQEINSRIDKIDSNSTLKETDSNYSAINDSLSNEYRSLKCAESKNESVCVPQYELRNKIEPIIINKRNESINVQIEKIDSNSSAKNECSSHLNDKSKIEEVKKCCNKSINIQIDPIYTKSSLKVTDSIYSAKSNTSEFIDQIISKSSSKEINSKNSDCTIDSNSKNESVWTTQSALRHLCRAIMPDKESLDAHIHQNDSISTLKHTNSNYSAHTIDSNSKNESIWTTQSALKHIYKAIMPDKESLDTQIHQNHSNSTLKNSNSNYSAHTIDSNSKNESVWTTQSALRHLCRAIMPDKESLDAHIHQNDSISTLKYSNYSVCTIDSNSKNESVWTTQSALKHLCKAIMPDKSNECLDAQIDEIFQDIDNSLNSNFESIEIHLNASDSNINDSISSDFCSPKNDRLDTDEHLSNLKINISQVSVKENKSNISTVNSSASEFFQGNNHKIVNNSKESNINLDNLSSLKIKPSNKNEDDNYSTSEESQTDSDCSSNTVLEGKSNTITCYKNQKEFNQLKSSACNNKTGFNVSQLIKTFEPQILIKYRNFTHINFYAK